MNQKKAHLIEEKRIEIRPLCRLVKETIVPDDVICEYQSQKRGDKIRKSILVHPEIHVKNKLFVKKMTVLKNLNLTRNRVWKLLEPAEDNDNFSKFIDIFLVNLIFFNILVVILETVETLYLKYKLWFIYFELFSVTIFSLEYISRFWSCVENKKKNETNGKARLRYIFSFAAIIDLIAILPSLLAFLFQL